MPMMVSSPALLSLVLLCGCAAARSSSTAERPEPDTAQRPEPDCSFRSASTCWTVAGRFPPRPPKAAAPKPDEIPGLAPTVLASEADSTRGSSGP